MNKYLIITSILIIGLFFVIFQKVSGNVYASNPKGRICLVIDDFGYANDSTIKEFLSLNRDFSVAIIPGHQYSQIIGELADSLGFETIIHMPMEPYNYDGLGEKGFMLTDKLNAEEVEQRIDLSFLEIPSAIGMNNHQGSKATTDLQLMKNIARSLKKRNKFFLDSFTDPESRGFITMRRFGVKTELRQVFLDHKEDSTHIYNQIDSLVNLSHVMDVAIGIGHVKGMTLSILKKEIPRLKKEGYEFVSLSSIVR